MGFGSGLEDFFLGEDAKVVKPMEIKPTSTLSPQQQTVEGQIPGLFAAGQTRIGGQQFTPEAFTPRVGQFSPQAETSLAALEQAALNAVDPGSTSNLALNDIIAGGGINVEELIAAMEADASRVHGQEQDVINARFGGLGFAGSERVKASGLAREAYFRSIGRGTAEVRFGAESENVQSRLAALGLSQTGGTAGADLLSRAIAGREIPRGIETEESMAEEREFKRQREEEARRAALMLAFVESGTYENIVDPALIQEASSGVLADILVEGAKAATGAAARGGG